MDFTPEKEISPVVIDDTKAKLLQLFKSRKFWAALVGLILIVIKGFDSTFPLEDEALTNIVYLLVAYILGTGIEDSGLLKA